MKLLAILALIPCVALAERCPDQSKIEAAKRKPCARWTAPEYKQDGKRVQPGEIDSYTIHYARTRYGVTTRGRVTGIKALEYFFQNSQSNASYTGYVMAHYTDGTMSEPSNAETWGKQ